MAVKALHYQEGHGDVDAAAASDAAIAQAAGETDPTLSSSPYAESGNALSHGIMDDAGEGLHGASPAAAAAVADDAPASLSSAGVSCSWW